jgi:hypothetical protein
MTIIEIFRRALFPKRFANHVCGDCGFGDYGCGGKASASAADFGLGEVGLGDDGCGGKASVSVADFGLGEVGLGEVGFGEDGCGDRAVLACASARVGWRTCGLINNPKMSSNFGI